MNTVIAQLAGRVRAFTPKAGGRFLFVGITGLVTDISILWLLERAGIPKTIARVISISVATLVTWALNRRITFDPSGRRPHIEVVRYYSVTAVAQTFNYVIFLAVLAATPTLPHTLAACIGSGLAAVLTYVGHRFFTFKPAKLDDGAEASEAA